MHAVYELALFCLISKYVINTFHINSYTTLQPFLMLCSIPLHGYLIIISNPSSTILSLGCFQSLTINTNTSTNTHVQ